MVPASLFTAKSIHGLVIHFDDAALREYNEQRASYDDVFSCTGTVHGPMVERFGQPCPILLHGLDGCWRYGHDLKKREHGFDLGDAGAGICFHGSMHYEGCPDVQPAIVIINLPAVMLGSTTSLASQVSRAFCECLHPAAPPPPQPMEGADEPVSDVAAAESSTHEAAGPSSDGSARPPSPSPPPRLVRSDTAVPSFMTAWRVAGLELALDAAALQEYHEAYAAYDEIFEASSDALKPLLASVGQCPIWLHGQGGCWKYGHALKLREHGVDLGDATRGLAWRGNMHYPELPEQPDSIFLVNLKPALLCHASVLVHELTHHFHFAVGPERLPMISAAYARALPLKDRVAAHFGVRNRGQFETTFVNEYEFFAYLMEARHACALRHARDFCAPAFPRTCDELKALDNEFGLGLVDALDSAEAAILSHAPATASTRLGELAVGTTPATEMEAALRTRFQALLAAQPGLDPTAAAAAALEDLLAPDRQR